MQEAGNLEQNNKHAFYCVISWSLCCLWFFIVFIFKCDSWLNFVLNKMLLLIANEMTGAVLRKKRSQLKDLKQTTANQTLQLSAAENK